MNKVQHDIHGILLLNKSIGLSSNQALQRVKRLFSAKKVGHTGSLDPLATGMLPLCFGEATKFSQFLLDANKSYRVSIKLGIKTTTGDAEGAVTETRHVPSFTAELLEDVFQKFTGKIQQIPPMYSAIKHQGKPLYRLARQGIEVARAPRTVEIYSIELLESTADTLCFDVHCSKGTYIRTLVEDIGESLTCGAYVTSLERLIVFPYREQVMYSFEELEALQQQSGLNSLLGLLLPIETCVQSLPAIQLSTAAAFYLRTGQPVIVPHLPTEGFVRVFADSSRFLGVGEILDDGRVAPRRLVSV